MMHNRKKNNRIAAIFLCSVISGKEILFLDSVALLSVSPMTALFVPSVHAVPQHRW